MEKHLHIVCLDVPYPVDYGGVFDLFYKIKELNSAGIRIHLHCFENGRPRQDELKKYCEEVCYYQRYKGYRGFSRKLPYIVSSRSNPQLPVKLLQDNYPVLLEGIHCTWLLNDARFHNRQILVRLHNIEHIYYQQLYHSTDSLFKKLYYYHEAKLLKEYEKEIAGKAVFLAVSETDAAKFQTESGCKRIFYLPPFIPYEEIHSNEGLGCYCLYHGNLSVSENDRAARWLIKQVFNDLKFPLVIAGKQPSDKLHRLIGKQNHTCLVANPSEQEMQEVVSKAQIHILPSFNCTGVKLKLLNALFNGRHCVVNDETVDGTDLGSACHIGTTANAFKSIISQLYNRPFYEEEVTLRKQLLGKIYNNKANATQLIQWIW